ncbi:MAG: diguanylate cyclase [Candidatus Omnitrophica bacterium]|nr:diguanylate cyclase [Candidatus Omnitrophota bacterium]
MNPIRNYLLTALSAMILTLALIFLIFNFPSLEYVDLKGRDLFFRLHHTFFPPPPEVDQLVLINLDDDTLRQLALRWPFPRSLYAEALDRLKPFHPKAVGFDLIFSGNDFSPGSDAAFVKALQEAGNVVIATHRNFEGEVGPSPLIRENASAVGIVDKPRDKDRMLRRNYFSFPMGETQEDSWELALFKKAFPEASLENLPLGTESVINYRIPFKEFPQISFWRLLEGSVLPKELENKIVMFGLTAETFHDIHATPIGSMPGLSVNANVLLMAMTRDFFSYAKPWMTTLLSFLSFWITLLVATTSSVMFGFVFIFFLILAFLSASFLLFSVRVLMDLWLVSLAVVLVFVGAIVVREWQLFMENLKLREESARDPLTGFYNRRFLTLKLKSEFKRLLSKGGFSKSGQDVSVVMLDLDNFKLVNDTFGHAEGDRVLCTMAEAIRSSVRKGELICRYGGDEFCVILPNTPIKDAARFAEKIRTLIENNPDLVYRTAGGVDTVRVTASVGVASVSSARAGEPGKLLKAADRALYRAKAGGRNQSCVFDPSRDVIT